MELSHSQIVKITNTKKLAELAASEIAFVRCAVADNKHTLPETLALLASDEDRLVRSYVAGNPRTPVETLAMLAKDDSGIQLHVAKNRNTPPEILAGFTRSEDEQLRHCAEENPSTPAEAVAELVERRNALIPSNSREMAADAIAKIEENRDKLSSVAFADLRGNTIAQALKALAADLGVELETPLHIDSRGEFSIVAKGGNPPACGKFGEAFSHLLSKHKARTGTPGPNRLHEGDGWCYLNHFNAEALIKDVASLAKREGIAATAGEAEPFEAFVAQYGLVENKGADGHDFLLETYGKDLDLVKASDPKRVWTIVEGDSGDLYLVAGFHTVNRLNYVITEKPWVTGEEEILYHSDQDMDEALTEDETPSNKV